MVKYSKIRIKSNVLGTYHLLIVKYIGDCLVRFGEAEPPVFKLLIFPKEF